MTRLISYFQQHATPAVRDAFGANPALEELLWQLTRDGQVGWPQLQVTPEQFTVFLARHLPVEAADSKKMSSLRTRDLYLTCALGLGDRAAQTIFATEYMPKVRQALLRLGTQEAEIAEIEQHLYVLLIEMQDAAVERRGYSGRGDLVGWLCTCAVRAASLGYRRAQKQFPAPQEVLLDSRKNPDLALLSGHMREAFLGAFQEALAALSSRDRNLLRYHFIAELNIDQIGNTYHVSRATAARWVARAQERLVAQVRERFQLRAAVSAESLPQVMALIQSHLSLNLGKMLKSTSEYDPL
jgi:RNA polymerase sigma-70 factor (ECF subfamily)